MDTKEKLLSVALKLILELGYNEVSLNRIVRESGVSKGAFYHYFKSKEELLHQLFHSYFLNYLGVFHSIISDSENPVKIKLELLSEKVIEVVHVYEKEANTGLYITMFEAMNQFEELKKGVFDHYKKLEADIVAMIDQAISDGVVRRETDSGAMALHIISLIEGLLLVNLMSKSNGADKKIRSIFSTLWNSMKI